MQFVHSLWRIPDLGKIVGNLLASIVSSKDAVVAYIEKQMERTDTHVPHMFQGFLHHNLLNEITAVTPLGFERVLASCKQSYFERLHSRDDVSI